MVVKIPLEDKADVRFSSETAKGNVRSRSNTALTAACRTADPGEEKGRPPALAEPRIGYVVAPRFNSWLRLRKRGPIPPGKRRYSLQKEPLTISGYLSGVSRGSNMVAALTAEQRTHGRAVTLLTAEIKVGDEKWPARIRNISLAGALVEGIPSGDVGTQVVLSRGSAHAAGEVLWRDTDALAIRFHEPIDLAEWLESRTSSGNSMDHDLGNIQSRHEDVSAEIIACRVREEMAFVSRLVEGVAGLLSEDPILRVRHATRIQELCMGEQMLNELSAVLERGCSVDAVLANVTGPMRQRLLRARIRGI